MKVNQRNKLIYGVGINDCLLSVKIDGVIDKCYIRWTNMLMRCYCESYQLKYPSYIGCIVSDEWKRFSIFRDWMIQQDWTDKHLDKDILVPNNKVYSSNTCVFIDRRINTFLNQKQPIGFYPMGVTKENSKYLAQCSQLNGKPIRLGLYNTPEEAHQAWKNEKWRLAQILIKDLKDQRIIDSLVKAYEVKI